MKFQTLSASSCGTSQISKRNLASYEFKVIKKESLLELESRKWLYAISANAGIASLTKAIKINDEYLIQKSLHSSTNAHEEISHSSVALALLMNKRAIAP